ncbi:MAG: hypothetical protein AB7T63_02880 [Planctomycetota bacterium]
MRHALNSPLPSPREEALQLDRYLDGEMPAAEAAAFEADLRRDTGRAAATARRRAFLEGLQQAGAAWRQGLPARTPVELEQRIRARLRAPARPPARRGLVFALRAAAALAVGALGVAIWPSAKSVAEAVPEPALAAVSLASALAEAPDPTTCASALDDPHGSLLVREGGFEVLRCTDARAARLRRIADLQIVGWAAEPAAGSPRGPDVGLTVLREHVIFDVRLRGLHEYLAVKRSAFAALHERLGERASCFVCHRHSRDGLENPHRIGQRAWGAPWPAAATEATRR